MTLTRILLIIALLLCVSAGDVEAQAWTPESGALSASASYSHSGSDTVTTAEGDIPNGGATSHILDLALEYGTPLDGLAVDVSLPIVGVLLNDDSLQHAPVPGEWDDGDFHSAPTDLRAGLRYQVLTDPVALAVHVAGSAPISDYPVKGFTAPGRSLRALHAGFAVGYVPVDLLPRVFLHARYEFSIAESFETFDPATSEFSQKRSTVGLQVGYFALDKLVLNLASNIVRSHGGVNFEDFASYTPATREFHDGLLNEDLLLLGGGASYTLSDRVDVGAAVRFFASGRNTREANIFNLSVNVILL